MDDLQIIRQCIEGDDFAWNEFIQSFGRLAQSILRRSFFLDSEDIENVIQNVLIKLHKGGLVSFRGATQNEFRAYFKTIVINEAKTYLTNENRWKSHIDDLSLISDDETETPQREKTNEKMKDPSPQPDLQLEHKQAIRIVEQALENFSLKDHQIFILKIKGYKENEISDVMGIPMGSVASAYSRMVVKVKEELKKNGID